MSAVARRTLAPLAVVTAAVVVRAIRRRRVFTAVIVTLIVAIGVSRRLLGVHFLSDVQGT